MSKKESTESPKLTGAFDLFKKSRDLIMENPKPFFILYALPLLWSLIQGFGSKSVVPSSNTATDVNGGLVAGIFVGSIVFIVVAVIIQTMLIGLELATANSEKPTINDLWPMVKKYWSRFIWLSLAMGFIILGGLILFIIPGIIFIRRYYLAPYFMVDQDLSVGDALKKSAAASKPVAGSIWSIIGVSVLIGMTGVVPLFGAVISTVLGLFYSVAPAIRYNEIKKLA